MSDDEEIHSEHLDMPRPETSHGQSHAYGEPESEIRMPIALLSEFQRLASAVHIDYTDVQDLLGLTSTGEQDITTSNLAYFVSEIIRKIDRLQHQPTTNYDYEYDEKEALKKKKKAEIDKAENKLLKKANKLDEEIQFQITVMKEQNPEPKSTNKVEKLSQKKLAKNYFKEKQQKQLLQDFIEAQNKKIKVLVEHIEKLMKTLKISTNKNIKLTEEFQLLKKEETKLKEKLDKQVLIINAQNRAIEELKEGSKILEDQLKLMDEKFLELRTKMDVSRNYFVDKLKKAHKEAMDLRVKFTLLTGQSIELAKVPGGMTTSGPTSKKGSKNNSHELLVAIDSEPALYPAQVSTPFAATNNGENNNRRASSPSNAQFRSSNNNNQENRRSSTSPTNNNNNNRPPLERKSSSFQEIKRLPSRPISAVSTMDTNYPETPNSPINRNLSQSHDHRPKSAFPSTGLGNNPSMTSLSRTSKEKQIIRRISSRAGENVWTAERIHELLDR